MEAVYAEGYIGMVLTQSSSTGQRVKYEYEKLMNCEIDISCFHMPSAKHVSVFLFTK